MLNSTMSKAVFHGNGVAVDFPFGFKVWDVRQLAVMVTDGTGVERPAEGWTASLGESETSGGTVHYVHAGKPLPADCKLTVLRDMPFVQNVDLISGTRFDPKVIEDQLDQATAERQQLKEGLGRAVLVPPSADETPDQLMDSLYQARDDAAGSATAAAASAAAALASEHKALGSAEESALSAAQSCACADRAEEARDVSIEQNALTNALMAVEMAKINAALAAGKDDNKASLAVAMAWAMNPLNVPVRLNPETGFAEYSALHWAEMARRAGLEEATTLKFGIAKLASELSLAEGHPTDVVTAAQWKKEHAHAAYVLAGAVTAFSGGFGGSDGKRPIPLGSTEADEGWALCDGTNGTPDLRGRFVLCAGDKYAAGDKGGAETHSHAMSGAVGASTVDWNQMPGHNHGVFIVNDMGGGWGGGWRPGAEGEGFTTGSAYAGSSWAHGHSISGATAAGSTLPPYYALAYIMKLAPKNTTE